MAQRDHVSRAVEQANPIRHEATFAARRAVQFLGQRRLAAAAHAVAHHHDLLNLQLLHRKLKRSGNAVQAGCGFERRDQRGDVANHEDLARIDIEDLRRIDPAVRTGDHQQFRRLAFLG